MRQIMAAVVALGCATGAALAENRIDQLRPDAPALAGPGDFTVGVRTITLSEEGRVDVLASEEEVTRAPRVLTAEFWYPATAGTEPGTAYQTVLRDGITETTLHGSAARDAEASAEGPFPLVVISHGYPGNRVLMSHLAEALASRGYAVVAPDHTDSTYSDQSTFGSTLYNRPLDQAQVIEAMAGDPEMAGLVDADRAAVVGYSMGGYGALIFGGAGVTEDALDLPFAPVQGLLAGHLAGSDSHEALIDERLRAVVAIGPWGMNAGFWDGDGWSGCACRR